MSQQFDPTPNLTGHHQDADEATPTVPNEPPGYLIDAAIEADQEARANAEPDWDEIARDAATPSSGIIQSGTVSTYFDDNGEF